MHSIWLLEFERIQFNLLQPSALHVIFDQAGKFDKLSEDVGVGFTEILFEFITC